MQLAELALGLVRRIQVAAVQAVAERNSGGADAKRAPTVGQSPALSVPSSEAVVEGSRGKTVGLYGAIVVITEKAPGNRTGVPLK